MDILDRDFEPRFVREEATDNDPEPNRERIVDDASRKRARRPVDNRVRTEASERNPRLDPRNVRPLRPRLERAVDIGTDAPRSAPAGGGGFGGGLGGTGAGSGEAGEPTARVRGYESEPAVTIAPDRSELISINRYYRRTEPTLKSAVEITLPEEARGAVRESPTPDQMRVVGEFHPVAKAAVESAPMMDENLISDGPPNLLDTIRRFLLRLFG